MKKLSEESSNDLRIGRWLRLYHPEIYSAFMAQREKERLARVALWEERIKQIEKEAEKRLQRNLEIVARRKNGETYKAISTTYGLSVGQVRSIVVKADREERRKAMRQSIDN